MHKIKLLFITYFILLTILACEQCITQENTPKKADLHNEVTEDDETKPNIALGQITLGKYNQQNHPTARSSGHTGNGACTCIVGTWLKMLQNQPECSLHQQPDQIDAILDKGITFYSQEFTNDAANNRATDIEDVLNKMQLEQDQTTMIDPHGIGMLQTKILDSQTAINQEINQFKNNKKLAVVRVGPEVWGLISYGNGQLDLFDSHGRPALNNGNAAAFIQRTNPEKVAEYIWHYSPLKAFSSHELNSLDEATILNGAVYIYWIQ